MPRSFRFEPPEPRPGTLIRPRLLRAVLGRWAHRVTAVVGGPGLGKTTLLAQAVAENRLGPRGEDVWIGVEPRDADGETLARDVAASLASASPGGAPEGAGPDDPLPVSDAVWRRAPTEVCLLFDDTHLLPPGSAGAAWLSALVESLPANGHLVLAGRTAPPIALVRLDTHGAMLRLGEDDLRFSDDELSGFAARRGIDPERLGETGGWPAIAELAASGPPRVVARDDGEPSDTVPRAGSYLWEEVLEPLGPRRRNVLAVLSDLGGADDELASAVLEAPVELDSALEGVPLVARGGDGWRAPHPLWRSAGGITLTGLERAAIRHRAVEHLTRRGRFETAFDLAAEAELWDDALVVLRTVCLSGGRPTSGQLDRWLDALPAESLGTAAGRLAVGLRAAVASPATSVEPLRSAVAACRSVGDVDGELAAIALLGRVAWWTQNVALLGEIFPRVAELDLEGHPLARALAALGRAVVADVSGDDAAVLAELESIEKSTLDPSWRAVADWLRAAVLHSMGNVVDALELLDAIPPVNDVAFQWTVEALRLVVRWSLGRVEDTVETIPALLEGIRSAGQAQNVMLGLANASLALAHVGDIDSARRYLDEAGPHESRTGSADVPLALARAALSLAEGDEQTASRLLEDTITTSGIETGPDRRAWRHMISLSYVLVPETRLFWDEARLHGHVALGRELAMAVVAVRSGGGRRQLAALELPSPGIVRSLLHHRFVAELAVGLHAAGRREGAALLDVLGPAGRTAVREVATGGLRSHARAAKSLLSTVPAPPQHATDVAVLGPLGLRRDGEEVADSDLRRERVRALLAFLVSNRVTTRAAITAVLWPDLGPQSAGNNLRVTLTYLLRVLEPWRAAGEPAYFVRLEGQSVELVTGTHLRVDVDDFDDHIRAAVRAEADGIPSLALDHNLAAIGLFRGDLHAEWPDAEWIALEREHYRTRFVAAATRAGELLVGLGDGDGAEVMARRAISVDPWAEQAYAVLAAAALARGDRTAARRCLDRCAAALAELGVEPSEEIRRLRRRIAGA